MEQGAPSLPLDPVSIILQHTEAELESSVSTNTLPIHVYTKNKIKRMMIIKESQYGHRPINLQLRNSSGSSATTTNKAKAANANNQPDETEENTTENKELLENSVSINTVKRLYVITRMRPINTTNYRTL